MVSVSRPWDGTNADLNGQLTDHLPQDVPGYGDFKEGRFRAGRYRGYWSKGDFVFYRVVEVVPCHGEWREIVRHGRCGNPAGGRYFVPKPQPPAAPPPPCVKAPPPPCPPPPCPPPPCPPPEVIPPPPPIPEEPPPPCPQPYEEQYQPHAGARIVHTSHAGADIMIGWGSLGRISRQRFCPPFPDKPILPPPVPPALPAP